MEKLRTANDELRTKKPELVSPAGEWSSMESAVKSGADAVYFGVKGINMRDSARNFDIGELPKITGFLHERGRKGYLALNVIVYDYELASVRKILETAAKASVDAVVLWDMSVLAVARDLGLNIHISTQASIANYEALKFFSGCGARRAVLARECGIDDISDITARKRKEGLDCQIEAFVHGSMCVSVSGRCFLSQLSFASSANRGKCLQPCRRKYRITDMEGDSGYVIGEDHILSPRDLCTVPFLERLVDAGIDAFKIEGRMRSPEYVREVTAVYREAVDAVCGAGLDVRLKKELMKRLKNVFNRGFSEGFYLDVPRDLGGKLAQRSEKTFIGDIRKFYKKIGVAELVIMNGSIGVKDKLLVYGKRTPADFFVLEEMQIDRKSVENAEKGTAVGIKIPFCVRPGDKVFLWKDKN